MGEHISGGLSKTNISKYPLSNVLCESISFRRLWRDVHDALLFAVLAVVAVGFDVPVAHKTGSSVQREQECGLDVTLARATGCAVQVLSQYTGIKRVARKLETCMCRMHDFNGSENICVLSLFSSDNIRLTTHAEYLDILGLRI